jgi:hypothetical protein
MVNFKRGEDRAKVYIGLLLVGVVVLFLLSDITVSEVTFIILPFGQAGSVQTDNYNWQFNIADYAYVVNPEAQKLYGGTYECNNGVITYQHCWQATEPGAGYKPDSYCPHPGPLLCPYGCEREGGRFGFNVGPSTSISRIKDLMCKNIGLADQYVKVNRLGMQVVIRSDTEYRVFAPDTGRYEYYDVTQTYKTFTYKTDSLVFGESGEDYAYATLYDGRCSYKLCFGSACSGLITSVECVSGEPITEPDVPEEPTPTDPTEPSEPTEPTDPTPTDPTEPSDPSEPTDPTPTEPTDPTEPDEPESPTGPESPVDPDRPVEPPRDDYGCLEESEVWCAEMNRCIELGEICEDGIYDTPGGDPLPGQDPDPIDVPDVDCGIEQHLVCASNGNTYLNDCWLKAYKATKVADGQCGLCGNDYIELGEQCDNNVVNQECKDLGFLDDGYVDCYNDCTLNTGDCRLAVCGDGAVEGDESWINCCLDSGCPSPNFGCNNNVCTPRNVVDFCLDGTQTNTCSENFEGYVCTSEGTLVEDCIQCGGCEGITCYEGQTSCDIETYTLSRCFNNQFIEVNTCKNGCRDEIQCTLDEEIEQIGGGQRLVKKVQKLFTPDFPKETTVITKEGVRPKTGDEILNEWITYKNIILASMLFIIFLVGRDTYTGKIKWKPIFKRIKKRFA